MVTSSWANSQRDWALIRRSNPFANLLGPLHKCELNDNSFRFLLSLERKRNNQAPSTEIISEAFQLAWSDLEVLGLVAPPARAELGPSPRVSLIFVTHGKVCLFQGRRHLCSAAAGSCLIIPGTPIRWVSTACSVVCVMLPWQNLGEMAASIILNGSEVVKYPLMLESPISCKPTDGQLDAHRHYQAGVPQELLTHGCTDHTSLQVFRRRLFVLVCVSLTRLRSRSACDPL